MAVTILGLGPGAWGQMTLEAQAALQAADEVWLRTARHPTVAHLPRHLTVHSFDDLYKSGGSFEEVYAAIVDKVLLLGRRPEGVIYAVPGHPLVAEATVRAIMSASRAASLPYQIIAGLSFLEPALGALELDPLAEGLQLADALDPRLEPDRPALIAQIYDRRTASDLKLTLLDTYPPNHEVRVVSAAGLPEQKVWTVELSRLDHRDDFDHLTCLYVPALAMTRNTATYAGFRKIVERLRAPDGCPWDRQQTHATLRPHLLEETYEVLDALDADDPDKLAEELGDLLLNILMQVQIAAEAGEFDEYDMYRSVSEKLIRRHPHVFGTVTASTA
ncbi:MAG: SAM-dependent methyltransferase, partial [Chloroflexi bacterium]|nr:SAM-dependent methyltransferase [Chloroflexota bacterium]